MNAVNDQEESKEETKMNSPPKDGESLMLKRILVNHRSKYTNQLKGKVCSEQGVSHKASVVKWLLIVVILIIWFPWRW